MRRNHNIAVTFISASSAALRPMLKLMLLGERRFNRRKLVCALTCATARTSRSATGAEVRVVVLSSSRHCCWAQRCGKDPVKQVDSVSSENG
jgi:hypothetical protein